MHLTNPMPNEPWRKALLPIDSSLQLAIRCLDESGLQIAVVVSAEFMISA